MWLGTDLKDEPMDRSPPQQTQMKYTVIAHGVPVSYPPSAGWLKRPDNVRSTSQSAAYAASLGLILKRMGLSVTVIKLIPTQDSNGFDTSQDEQQESFLCEAGSRGPAEFGVYERFLDISLTRDHAISRDDRKQETPLCRSCGSHNGEAIGIPEELIDKIQKVARIKVDRSDRVPDVCIIELGNSAHSRDMAPVLKALQGLRIIAGKHNFIQTLIVSESLSDDEELQSVDLWKYSADMVICCQKHEENDSTEGHLCSPSTPSLERQLAIDPSRIIIIDDNTDTIRLPFLLEAQNDSIISRTLTTGKTGSLLRTLLHLDDLSTSAHHRIAGAQMWTTLAQMQDPAPPHRRRPGTGNIVLIGTTRGSKGPHTLTTWRNCSTNPYSAIVNALSDASPKLPLNSLNIVDPTTLSFKSNDNNNRPNHHHPSWHAITAADGIILPDDHHHHLHPSTKKAALAIAAYARTHQIPFLAIGSGMHTAVEAFAQTVSNIPHPVPTKNGGLPPLVPQRGLPSGGEAQDIYIPPASHSRAQEAYRALYGGQAISTRERFDGGNDKRVHPVYAAHMRECGFDFFCRNAAGEILDAWKYSGNGHPFYVGVGFHPEFATRVVRASDVVFEFVKEVHEMGWKRREKMGR